MLILLPEKIDGMILSDKHIKRLMELGKIKIIGMENPEIQIQPSSVDLRLGNEFRIFKTVSIPYLDPLDCSLEKYTELIHVEDGKPFLIHPGDFVLGTTKERIEIGNGIVARIEGRSSLGRLGIIVHATAGYIDPGFRGQITLEISNISKVPVALYPGMRICQVVFEVTSSESEFIYGEKSNKYQDQEGPTASRIYLDEDLKFLKKFIEKK